MVNEYEKSDDENRAKTETHKENYFYYFRSNGWSENSFLSSSFLFLFYYHYSMDYIGLGCCALAFVLYLNTLDAGFVYDDR